MRTETIELDGQGYYVTFEYFAGDPNTGVEPEYHIVRVTPVDKRDVINELERIRRRDAR